MLKKDDWIVLPDAALQQSLRVGRRCWQDDSDARTVKEVGLKALAVLSPELMTASLRCANNHRHLGVTAEHVMDLGGVVNNLIHCEQAEIYCHQLDNWLQPTHRGANPRANDG